MNIYLQAAPPMPLNPAPSALPGVGASFGDLIAAAIGRVEETQGTADQLASALFVDGRGDVHSVALASQKAELSMEMFQQVRNKFVQAYQEVMKMPM